LGRLGAPMAPVGATQTHSNTHTSSRPDLNQTSTNTVSATLPPSNLYTYNIKTILSHYKPSTTPHNKQIHIYTTNEKYRNFLKYNKDLNMITNTNKTHKQKKRKHSHTPTYNSKFSRRRCPRTGEAEASQYVRTQLEEAEPHILSLGGESWIGHKPSSFGSTPTSLSRPTSSSNEFSNSNKHTQSNNPKYTRKHKFQHKILLELRNKNKIK
jgi:hypothetical protein